MSKDIRETKAGDIAIEKLTGDLCAQVPQVKPSGKVWFPNFSTKGRVVTFNYCSQKWARLEWRNGDGSYMPIAAMRVCSQEELNRHDFVLFDSYVNGWTNNLRSSSIVREDCENNMNDYRTTQFRVIRGFMNWCNSISDPFDENKWENVITASKPSFVALCGEEKPFAIV